MTLSTDERPNKSVAAPMCFKDLLECFPLSHLCMFNRVSSVHQMEMTELSDKNGD